MPSRFVGGVHEEEEIMKLMRLAICVAVFAVVGGIAVSEDIEALQAKVAAQEARLNDLQAKMNSSRSGGGDADGIVSLRKNAVVTLGGTVNTRYFYRSGKINSTVATRVPGATPSNGIPAAVGAASSANRIKRFDDRTGDMRISDAKVEMKIDVNEYFDAYLKMDLQDGAGRSSVSGIAQNYWIRWKNVCNTGFGLLVGRDALKFGDSQPIGILDTWAKDNGGMSADIMGWNDYAVYNMTQPNPAPTGSYVVGTAGDGMLIMGGIAPARTTYNWTRTTQINPYWESQDGKLRFDMSFIQSIDRINGLTDARQYTDNGVRERRSINYGLGSMTARVVWKPIEGLKLTASAMNLYAQNSDSTLGLWGHKGNGGNAHNSAMINVQGTNDRLRTAKNDTTLNLAFQYRPCFFSRLNVWGQWMHGWNTAWIDDQDSDVVNFGASYDINDRMTFFAQGDYVRTKNDQSVFWNKGTGWAFYTGLNYKLPYGVNIEGGWRHEQVTYKGKGGSIGRNEYQGKHTKYKGDTIYAHLGFDF